MSLPANCNQNHDIEAQSRKGPDKNGTRGRALEVLTANWKRLKQIVFLMPTGEIPKATASELITAATFACAAPVCPTMNYIRPVIVEGRHTRIEMFR